MSECMLCDAERLTDLYYEDEEVWVTDCVVCMTPMVVWTVHGLPDPVVEGRLLTHLEREAKRRYGPGGYYVDGQRRRIPDHWHAHARPVGGFFDPRSSLYRPDGAGM
ncbi:MAG: hypothetical protein QOI60_1312 [Actinomycetota bacterium]|nr:hypothetical protein [Actinomycetota bacterium]